MISIKIQSDSTIIFKIKENINKVDFERISLYIESLVGYNFQTTIQFMILSKHKNLIKKEIEAYCQNFPYNYQIN